NAEKLVDQARHDSVSNAIQGAKYLADDAVVKSLFTSQTETQISELASVCLDFDISMVLFLDKADRPLYLHKEGKLHPQSDPDFRGVTNKLGLVRWDGENAALTSTITQGLFGQGGLKRATITTLDEDGRDIVLAGNTVSQEGTDALGKIVIAYKIPGDVLKLANEFSQSAEKYRIWASGDERRAIRRNYLLWLGLITLLILFFAVWVG